MFVDMTADIAHTLHPHRQLLVAFSGGLDSTVLLHQLVLLREQDPSLTLRAVHVHHGLSAHADDWVAHCRQICQQWQVPLVVHHVTLARGGLGVEAHARAARYQAFQDTLNAGEVLVTAQHQDDQCETLLLALKRGSGPTGLSAMAPSSAFAGSRLLRPLLNETRESLRQWALAHQLSWIEDESNQDDTYDRNFLRLRVIPVLRERWPHFSEAVARSASLCAEQEQLLDEMLAAELASLVAEDGSLAIAPLATMSPPRRAALLRRWLAGQQAPMPAREVPERLWHEVALAREDASPCLRLADGLGELTLQPGGRLRPPSADEPVTVRFRASGHLHIVGRHGGRKLKKLWQELGVAPWRRDTTPLLFYGETPIAAADDLFVTTEGEVKDGEGVRLMWRKTGD
nr:tRNA lysidine(34) synthetase TilS [Klebsiella pneumoniae]